MLYGGSNSFQNRKIVHVGVCFIVAGAILVMLMYGHLSSRLGSLPGSTG